MPDPRGPFLAACPTRLLLDQLADKWSVLILVAVTDQPVRFNALKRQIEGISQKMLGQTLRRLEENGLVSRTAFPTVPVTVEYAITPLGTSLVPIVEALRQWAIGHMPQVAEARTQFMERGWQALTRVPLGNPEAEGEASSTTTTPDSRDDFSKVPTVEQADEALSSSSVTSSRTRTWSVAGQSDICAPKSPKDLPI